MTPDPSTDRDHSDPDLQARLQDLPVPPADPEFYDRALARALVEGRRQQRSRWVLTGFGAAVAAGLTVWLLAGLLLDTRQVTEPATPAVTMTLAEPRTVNLVFASAEALEQATLTVSLPPGVELAGFPGQAEIRWQTRLQAGRNLLPLQLIALTPAGGELLARLEHDNRDRLFRLHLDVS